MTSLDHGLDTISGNRLTPLISAIRADILFWSIALIYLIAAWVAVGKPARALLQGLTSSMVTVVVLGLLAAGVSRYWTYAFITRPERPLVEIGRDLKRAFAQPQNSARILSFYGFFCLFTAAFVD